MSTQAKSGLVVEDGSVPLEGVRIDARLRGASVEVTVTQRYRNREKVPVEATYVFPLDEASAVCGFSALVGGARVVGEVREREAAFAAYDDAMHRGDGAFLLDQERPNVFTASVGNLRPGEEVELQLRYVALVPREGDAVRLAIPTTVSPRYVPDDGPSEIGQPDGERVNPEHWPEVPYGLHLTVDVAEPALRRLESPSHPIRTTLREGGALVELAQDEVALDRDFVLRVESATATKPVARVARERDGRRVMMLTFLPQASASTQAAEVLFVLDCSGSMQGDSIAQAKRALALSVRALHPGDTFNVVCFGSRWKALWKAARPFDDASLAQATRYLDAADADLGGTEIFDPLKALLEAPLAEERARRLVVLTDGQVSNEDEVIALAQRHAGKARIFAFGIGAGASEYLVRGLSRASRGAAEMIFPGERIEPKVLRMLGRVRAPVLDDVRVDYHGMEVEQAPHRTPPAFTGDALTVFARIERGVASEVELCVGDARWSVPIDLEHAEADGPIPTLWARECIRELELPEPSGSAGERAEKAARARLVELGTRYGLLSSATSYVAIEQREEHDRSTAPAALRRIPVALTHGWGGGRYVAAPTGAPIPMVAAAFMPASPARFLMRAVAPAPMASAPAPQASGPSLWDRARAMFSGDAGGDDTSLSPPMAIYDDEPEAPEGDTGDDRLYALLMTQRADGSFLRSPALEDWLERARLEPLARACAEHGEAVVVTSLVIALLERAAPERASEWGPAVDKARAWCAKQPRFDASALV